MSRVRQLGIQASIFVLTIGLVIGSAGVVGGAALAIFSAYRAHIERWEMTRAHRDFAAAIDERGLDNLRTAELIARLPAVREALTAGDRARLLSELEGAYAVLAPKQIDRMHVYRTDGTTFLRVHRPDDTTDDGRIAQEVIYRTNRDHVPRHGIDLGPNGVRLRGVVPIFDAQGQPLGVLDVSTYVTPAFMRQIEIGQTLYRVFLLGRGGYHLAVESGGSPAPLLSNEALALTNRGLEVALRAEANGTQFLTTAIPLLDYDKDNIGAVQIDIDMSEIETRYRELIVVLIVGSLLVLAAGIAWGAAALRGITSPVEALIRTTDRIAAGGARDPVPLQDRNDTVGRFARALEHLRTSKLDVEHQKSRAEEASAAKSKFLAVMSHELRTPLNAVIGFSELLLHGVGTETPSSKQSDYLRDISASGRHLHELLTEIMTMARLESGKFEARPRRIDLAELVNDVVGMMKASAVAADVTLLSDVAAPLSADADPTAIRQVVLNLLSNALKFTPPGGTVKISAAIESGFARIVVADTGIGIPREKLDDVFLPFEQIEDALSRRNGGVGLGLTIVKSLLELHNGTIEIDSDQGRGTRVAISWPAAMVSAATQEAAD